jgi:hypothetical protein
MFVRDVEAVGAGGQAIIQRRCQPLGRHLFAFSLLTRAPLRIPPGRDLNSHSLR